MLSLYHAPFSVTSQKVRMTLAEKGQTWTDVIIDLMAGQQYEADFSKLNEDQQVPVLVHDDHVLKESSLICEYVNEAFAGVDLLPSNPLLRYEARAWVDWIERNVHISCGVLTYAVLARPIMATWPDATRNQLLEHADRAGRHWQRNAVMTGFDSSDFEQAIANHKKFFDRMEQHLPTAHSWLTGTSISLADIAALPYVMRADHLGVGELFSMGTHPNLRAWYMRMLTRQSSKASFVDYLDATTQETMMQLVMAAQPQFQDALLRACA